MSLKNFHILFIMIAIITTAGFGFWCFFTEAGKGAPGSTVMGVISLVSAVALVIYGVKFLRKMKEEGIQ